MVVPNWFDENVYFSNKLEQVGKEWDSAKLQAAFDEAGYGDGAEGLFKHFQDFGNAENISPSKYFDVAEYLKAKAEQLNAMEEGVGFEGHQWNEASVLSAIRDAGLSAWDHYTQFGMYEGVNPSNLFDANEYLAMKLASLQAEEPDKNWTEDSMLEAFREAGLNPVEHYFLFGQDEGLPLSPVPDAEKVITDFDPHSPSNPGETFTLANGPEVLDGTAMDDVFNAVAGSTNASRTLDQGDKIDGKGGNDTLNVAMEANFNGFTNDGSMTNVEKVVLTNEGRRI